MTAHSEARALIDRLRVARMERGWTLKETAEAARSAGGVSLGLTAIQRYESYGAWPSLPNLIAWSRGLGVVPTLGTGTLSTE